MKLRLFPTKHTETCPDCNGTGACINCYNESYYCTVCGQTGKCPTCHGRGVVTVVHNPKDRNHEHEYTR
jgi:DnaJ-class molecular chaperone